MNKIKVATLFTVLCLILCTNTAIAKTNNNKTESKKMDNKVNTVKLDKQLFLEKVANYETNPDEWIYLGNKPCIIDFYADWCGPCKALSPILEELAAEYGDKLVIYKINTDIEKELAQAFGIRSIPTLLFCSMDDKPRIAQGALPKNELKKIIKEILKVE